MEYSKYPLPKTTPKHLKLLTIYLALHHNLLGSFLQHLGKGGQEIPWKVSLLP